MKVYLLWYRQSSGDWVVGVFDSLEKATDRRSQADDWDQRCMDIEEEYLQ